jgi:hypothetical protein
MSTPIDVAQLLNSLTPAELDEIIRCPVPRVAGFSVTTFDDVLKYLASGDITPAEALALSIRIGRVAVIQRLPQLRRV